MTIVCGVNLNDLDSVPKFQGDTAHVVTRSSVPLFGRIHNAVQESANAKKSRGSIDRIDAALAHWHVTKVGNNKAEVEKSLYGVIKECRHWIAAKTGKEKASTATRMRFVQAVCDAAWVNLRTLNPALDVMQSRKSNQVMRPVTKTMDGAYQHERTFYTNSGKSATASGSLLHEKMKSNGQGAKFDILTAHDYITLANKFRADDVQLDMVYLNKLQRSAHMVSVDEGYLYDVKGVELDSDFLEPYAMDKYSSLFTMKLKGGVQINHSSMLAGKDVLCAGCLGIKNGLLVSVDNNSGHYKPTAENLLNAIDALNNQGVLLTDTVAGFKRPTGVLQWYKVVDLWKTSEQVKRGIYPALAKEPDFRG